MCVNELMTLKMCMSAHFFSCQMHLQAWPSIQTSTDFCNITMVAMVGAYGRDGHGADGRCIRPRWALSIPSSTHVSMQEFIRYPQRTCLDPRGSPLRWHPQQFTNVAAVSQIAAPQRRRGLSLIPAGHLCAGPPRNSEVATVSQIAAPQERRGLSLVPVGHHCAGVPSSSRKWRQFHRSQPLRGGEASTWSP